VAHLTRTTPYKNALIQKGEKVAQIAKKNSGKLIPRMKCGDPWKEKC